jgi:hypothetical protein
MKKVVIFILLLTLLFVIVLPAAAGPSSVQYESSIRRGGWFQRIFQNLQAIYCRILAYFRIGSRICFVRV